MLASSAPDLVTTFSLAPNKLSFQAGEAVQVSVVVTNRGTAPAGPFWVDFYINPAVAPTQPNQLWYEDCGLTPCYGVAWYVSGLAAGQSMTLTSTPASYSAGHTIWPGWFAAGSTDLYAFVDSWNPDISYGGVAESDEQNNRAELHGLSVTGTNPAMRPQPRSMAPRSLPSR